MEDLIFSMIGAATGVIIYHFIFYFIERKRSNSIPNNFNSIINKIDEIPDIVIKKATGKTNYERGNLGELIAFLQLKSGYDKILPFHDIVDFIGIRFPNKDETGTITFIDIKTGNARLTKEQKALQEIIENKNIQFSKVKININDIVCK